MATAGPRASPTDASVYVAPADPGERPLRLVAGGVVAGILLMFIGAVISNTTDFTLAEIHESGGPLPLEGGSEGPRTYHPEDARRLASIASRSAVAGIVFNVGLALASVMLLAGGLFLAGQPPAVRAAMLVGAGLLLWRGFQFAAAAPGLATGI